MTVKGLHILLEVANSDAVTRDDVEAAIMARATHYLDDEQRAQCVACVLLLRQLAYRGLVR